MSAPQEGYAPVHGMQLYYERRGSGGVPLVLVHGGYGLTAMFGDLLDVWAGDREVIAVDLQGHGHTGDIDRPFSFEAFGDDIAGLAEHLGLAQVDLFGYSLGGLASLRCALQHPELIRRLVLLSIPVRRDAWYPEVRAAFDAMGPQLFERLRHSPMYDAWRAVTPDPEGYPALIEKTGALMRHPYDWTEEVRNLSPATLLVYGDADSVSVSHIAEFFALLGGGAAEPGWEAGTGGQHRLAVLPGQTHYDLLQSPVLAPIVEGFLGDRPGGDPP